MHFMNFSTCLLIALGGAIGTLGRYGLSTLALPISDSLPWGTIIINVLGSFVIGFFGTLTLTAGRFPLSEDLRLFVMVGVCGGFTTFSAFSLQTLDLLRDGAVIRAITNVLLSVLLSIAAVAIGHSIAAQLNGGAQQIAQLEIEEEA
jgi:fluoride exporter